MKVGLFDYQVKILFWKIFSKYSAVISFFLLFDFIPTDIKKIINEICPFLMRNQWVYGVIAIIISIGIYFWIWYRLNKLQSVNIKIDGCDVCIKAGDLFSEPDLKVIAFNEYFDTQVDDKIIASASLNGIYINKFFPNNTQELDDIITNNISEEDLIEKDSVRKKGGKSKKYKLSTLLEHEDFILTAFTRFDENNRAYLSMPDYIEFLINFWDRINQVYAQRSVSVPIFGSGITRIKEHKNISDEELLKIMLWTFKLSETKFKYPAKLTIIIHGPKLKEIDLSVMQYISKEL